MLKKLLGQALSKTIVLSYRKAVIDAVPAKARRSLPKAEGHFYLLEK
jgi:hypothetical protein